MKNLFKFSSGKTQNQWLLPTMEGTIDATVTIRGDKIDVVYRLRPGAKNLNDKMLEDLADFGVKFISSGFSFKKYGIIQAALLLAQKFKFTVRNTSRWMFRS